MQKFDRLTGIAAPLNILNIDTDMIIPKQFLKTIKRSGLGAISQSGPNVLTMWSGSFFGSFTWA